MLIKRAVLDAIASGEVTFVFRRWKQPTVKTGGKLTTAVGVLAIDEVQPTTLRALTARDAELAGWPTRAALVASLRGRPGRVYRIALHLVGPDPRLALRELPVQPGSDYEALLAKLDAMDRASRDGAWTRQYLQLIADQPETLAADMAASIGSTKKQFKPRVRRLKELGLTISFRPGYRLSKRGQSLLQRLKQTH